MKRTLCVLALVGLALVAGLPWAGAALSGGVKADERALSAANALVDAGHAAEAVQIYEQLVAQGARDGALLYNLGNAYYQQGDLKRALASYEQAAALTPRDPDLRHNLALARSQAGALPARAPGLLGELAETSRQWLTVNELAALALAAWLLFGALVLAYRHFQPASRPAALRYAAAVALLCVMVTGVSLASRVMGTNVTGPAPVLIESLDGQAL
jgi:tetratricopeptide (TPR) repeat protein